MSYNYDYDPWADSQQQNSNQQASNDSNQQSQNAYGDYSSSSYQYQQNNYTQNITDSDSQLVYNNSSSAAYYASDTNYGQNDYSTNYNQEQQQPQPHSNNSQQTLSGFTGFLRRNVPIVGTAYNLGAMCCKPCMPVFDLIFKNVNKDLLVAKTFYFFFYSAFGSLFPLMGVYFKQLGMNPAQVGILTGIRPFIEIFSAPFWSSLAEKFRQAKTLLMFSLISWIIFTYSLAHIKPPASACIAFNDSDYVLYTPYSSNDLANYEVYQSEELFSNNTKQTSLELDIASNHKSNASSTSKSEEDPKAVRVLAIEENQDEQRRRRRRRSIAMVINEAHKLKFNPEINLDIDEKSSNYLRLKRYSDNKDAETEVENETEENEGGSETDLKTKSNETNEESPSEKEKFKDRSKDQSMLYEDKPEDKQHHQKESEQSSKGRKESGNEVDEMKGAVGVNNEEEPKKSKKIYKQRHKTPPTHIVGKSPITVEYAANYNKDKHSKFVTPMFSTIVYKLDDIQEVFFLLLLLISLGEFFSAPALTLADSATLSYLGERADLYGRQRMFGSLSWAITLLFVGMALDNSKSFAEHPCGPHQRERSYTVCFAIFALLMFCALITASKFNFDYAYKDKDKDRRQDSKQQAKALLAQTGGADNTGDCSQQVVTTVVDSNLQTYDAFGDNNNNAFGDPYASTKPRSIFNTAPPINEPPPNSKGSKESKFEYLEKWRSGVFAQQTRELPEWFAVFKQFNNTIHLTYLFITWFLGCGVGLVFTFLFWHLQDVGGTPTLFGICSIINHISEILAYFFSFHFIKNFGHTKVLGVGLACNVFRFVYVALLSNPYYALPFELVQGITHATCFAACCSYISRISKPELRASTQGVMQGLHHGLGRASGTLIGGYMINTLGSRVAFGLYGLMSGMVLAGFLYVRKRASHLIPDINDITGTNGEDMKLDENDALGGYGAPQGVPVKVV